MEPPPRYRPLRPLPARAYVPGRSERPAVEPGGDSERAAPDSLYLPAERWAEHAKYLWGVDLYNAGFFWEAHEAWEASWRAADHDPIQQSFIKGLIQCAAACLKGVLEDRDSARRIAERALERLERTRAQSGDCYMGLDVAQFHAAFRDFIERDPTLIADRPALVLSARS